MNINQSKKQERRADLNPIKVYCTRLQREAIAVNAKLAGMSLSTYLLRMGIQHVPVIDSSCREDIEKLLKINADLGRLGGLIKLWLTNDKKTRMVGEAQLKEVLHDIAATQNKMADAIAVLKKANS